MIRSLLDVAGDQAVAADVHVVGGGIAGLIIATRLAKRGLRVVVTESGGLHQAGDTHPLNEVDHLRSHYHGAEAGRARCLGGTSTRWGGAMIPFLPADLAGPAPWPVPHAEIVRYLPEVEALFHLPAGSYEEPELARMRDGSDPAYLPRLAKWPSFGRRNVASLLDPELRAATGPEIWIEATATDFAFAPDGRIAGVTARAANGRRLTVTARETVFAAGAIESTRLALLADAQADGRIFAPDDVLGRYFHDHLSVVVGTIEPRDRTALNRVAGFRFEGAGMRNLRFEPSEAAAVRARVPPGFAHIAFAGGKGSGFDALRDVFRLLQQRRLPGPATLIPLARGAPWLARALWWRYREQRLLYPGDARIELNMVIEQEPRRDNRISLSAARRDRFDRPLAAIDWAVSGADAARLTASTDLFLDYWQRSSLADLGTIARRSPGEAEREMADGAGIYHPGGSTRMGATAADGVVDPNLRTHRVPNLSIAATSVFPTGGGANPTMMLMMASMRLADRLAAGR